jgi:hypothetical protein
VRHQYGGGARDSLFKITSRQRLSSHGKQLLRDVSLINSVVSEVEKNEEEELLTQFKESMKSIEERFNIQLINEEMMQGSGG